MYATVCSETQRIRPCRLVVDVAIGSYVDGIRGILGETCQIDGAVQGGLNIHGDIRIEIAFPIDIFPFHVVGACRGETDDGAGGVKGN